MFVSMLMVLYSLFDFFSDFMYRGLGASNGRWVSFLQSVESAYSYRIQMPFRANKNVALSPRSKIRLRRGSVYYAGSDRNEIWRKLYLGFICGWLKFGTGTFISIMLGVEPVLAKSWRHFASFGVALMCIQLTPKDMFFQRLSAKNTRGLFLRLCMFVACAIYKLRKMTFVVHTTRILGYRWGTAIFLCVVECEGSGILRRTENRMSNIKWTLHGLSDVVKCCIIDLIERTNFWLSILVACTLTLGAHLGDEIAGPHVYTIPHTLNVAAMCILLIRHCRTTVIQILPILKTSMLSDSKAAASHGAMFTTMTSTPSRNLPKRRSGGGTPTNFKNSSSSKRKTSGKKDEIIMNKDGRGAKSNMRQRKKKLLDRIKF